MHLGSKPLPPPLPLMVMCIPQSSKTESMAPQLGRCLLIHKKAMNIKAKAVVSSHEFDSNIDWFLPLHFVTFHAKIFNEFLRMLSLMYMGSLLSLLDLKS